MTALLIVSILLVALYVGATIWRKRELPESVSAMVYELPKGGWQWAWTVWLWIVAIFTLAPAIEILDKSNYGFVGFLTMGLMVFVGAWPLFQSETRTWHYVGGCLAGLMSQVCTCLICPMWLLLWLLMVVISLYSMKADTFPWWLEKKGVFISEAVCYLSLMGAMFTHLLMN